MFGVIFTELCDDAAYINEKVAAILNARHSDLDDSVTQYLASTVVARHLDLPMADSKETLANLPKDKAEHIQGQISTMEAYINSQYPLLKSEELVDDNFTFLVNDFEGHQKGTPLLIRKTDKSTMVIFFDHLLYKGGIIQSLRSKDQLLVVEYAPPPPVFRTTVLIVEDLVISFFKGMLSEIGSKTGAAIFKKIFPDSSADLENLLNGLKSEIRNIIRQELDAQRITDLNAQMTGVVKLMQGTYTPAKDSGRQKDFLETMLLSQHTIMTTNIMAQLIDQRYRSHGIAYLLTGANAHLAIIWELVTIDAGGGDIKKSPYYQTYKIHLNNYIAALNNARSEAYNERLGYLSALQESTLQGAATDHWWFCDNWVNPIYHSPDFYNSCACCDCKNDARSKANNARNAYSQATFVPTIVTDLEPYQNAITAWSNQYALL